MSSKSHIFALYYAQLPSSKIEGTFLIDDISLIQRLNRVLRASEDQELILFNTIANAHIVLKAFDKKHIEALVLKWELNKQIAPLVTWWLPLLEKNDWEDALSFLTILGATTIQPLITKKTHRQKLFDGESERLQRVIIAAAEQSKQFSLPTLEKVITLENALKLPKNGPLVFFDVNGQSAYCVMTQLENLKPAHITCMVGPEGDLTDEEKGLIKSYGFQFCALTTSILRSTHASFLGMGLIRSLIRSTASHQE